MCIVSLYPLHNFEIYNLAGGDTKAGKRIGVGPFTLVNQNVVEIGFSQLTVVGNNMTFSILFQ